MIFALILGQIIKSPKTFLQGSKLNPPFYPLMNELFVVYNILMKDRDWFRPRSHQITVIIGIFYWKIKSYSLSRRSIYDFIYVISATRGWQFNFRQRCWSFNLTSRQKVISPFIDWSTANTQHDASPKNRRVFFLTVKSSAEARLLPRSHQAIDRRSAPVGAHMEFNSDKT